MSKWIIFFSIHFSSIYCKCFRLVHPFAAIWCSAHARYFMWIVLNVEFVIVWQLEIRRKLNFFSEIFHNNWKWRVFLWATKFENKCIKWIKWTDKLRKKMCKIPWIITSSPRLIRRFAKMMIRNSLSTSTISVTQFGLHEWLM